MLTTLLLAAVVTVVPNDASTLRRSGDQLLLIDDRTRAVIASAPVATTDRIVVRGARDFDDLLTIDLTEPIPLAGGIDYDGGAAGWDVLALRGGSARVQRVTQLTPHDGVIDVDGLVIRYSNLEPITDTAAAASYTIVGTAGADTVTVSDGPGGTTTVSSPSFESVTFANKTNVVFDGLGGGDTVNFNNPNPATGLVSFIVTNVATVSQTGAVRYAAFGVNATGAVTLNTVASNDADNFEATTQNGNIFFTDADEVTIGGVSAALTGVRVVTAGSIIITTSNGGMVLSDTDGPEIVRAGATSGFVTLNVFGSGADLTVPVDNDAIAATGSVAVNATGQILLGTAGATFSNNVTAGDFVQLNGAGGVVVDGLTVVTSDAYGTASGGNVLVTSANAITIGGSLLAAAGAGADVIIVSILSLPITIEGSVASQSGDVTLRTSKLTVEPAATVSAPAGRVMIETSNNAPHIDLGSTGGASATALELSDAELDRITGPIVSLETFIGTITVSQPISFTGELQLRTPNFFTATGTGSLTASALRFVYTFSSPKTWTITPTTIQITGGAPVPYSATTLFAESIPGGMASGNGNDTFFVTPSPTTTINVDGNLPTPPAVPGDSLVFNLAGVVAPVLNATLTANGYQGSLVSANRQPVNFADIESIVDGPADLVITKSDGVATATPGTPITYTITVNNPSPSSVTSANVADTFPPQLTGVTWTCAPSAGSTCTAAGSGNINDTISLAANGSVTYTATGTIPSSATGSLVNTATLTAATDTNAANNSATETTPLVAESNLILTKTTDTPSVLPGGELTFTITLRNSGPSDAANVELADVLPAGTLFTSFTAPPGYACTTGATITCSRTTLAPSATADTFTLVVRVDATSPPGTVIANTVTATSTSTDPSANTATATITVSAAPAGIPTLSQWMLLLLSAALAFAAIRRA